MVFTAATWCNAATSHSFQLQSLINSETQSNLYIYQGLRNWLVGRLMYHFNTKIGYIGDKVLGGDLVPPGFGWPTIQ